MKIDNIGTTKVTTLATCIKLTRKDGVVMGFTDYIRDIVISDITYVAKSGYTATAISSAQGLAVDNVDVEGALSSDSITEADLTAGLYDFATITVFQVNYLKPDDSQRILKSGFIGQVTRGDNTFKAEIRGLSQMTQRDIGELYSETCRADLGDSRCKIDLVNYTHTGSVTAVSESTFTVDINKDRGYFTLGLLVGITGKNAGVRMEIVNHVAKDGVSTITTFLPLPQTMAVGDTFTLSAGCDRLFSTCKTRFNNYINFRGEPGIPGTDKIIKYAKKQ